MAHDVYLNTVELEQLIKDLKGTVDEFESACEVRGDLQDAVGRPQGRGSLRSRVGNFENNWNHTRGELKEGLTEVHDHLKDIVDGFTQWDEETRAALESNAPDGPPGASLHAPQAV